MTTDHRVGESYRPLDLRTILLAIVVLILIGWALRALTPVLVPLVAAVLIALAVMPVRDWVQERVSDWLNWLGTAAAMALILLILAVFFGGIWIAAQQVVSKVPNPSGQITGMLQGSGQEAGQEQAPPDTVIEGAEQGAAEGSAQGSTPQGIDGSDQGGAQSAEAGVPEGSGQGSTEQGGGGSGRGVLPSGSMSEVLPTLGNRALGAAGGVAATILNSALSVIAGLVLIFFFTLLLLIESPDWRRKVETVTQPRTEWRLTESANVIASKVRRYLVLRTILGLVTAALYGLWLWFFGVGLILVWALLTLLLNFVPTIGSLIAGLLPVAYALLTQSWGTALGVAAGLLVIEQIMGNYIDPRVQGNNISLSPLVILVALVFWGWVWGIPGALLAVPVTVSLVVLAAHVPALRSWALLLTNRTDMEGLDEATRPR